MIPALKKALDVLNLSEKQNAVFSVLLESGPMLVAAIAKEAKLNRTTTYDIVHELAALGLVSQTKKQGATRFQAIAPEMLPGYLERRRAALEESKKQLNQLLPELKLLRTRSNQTTRIQYFEGIEGIKQAYEDTVEHNKGKVMYGFLGGDVTLEAMGYDWINAYINKRTSAGIHAYTVATDTPTLRKFKSLDPQQMRDMKLLPPGYQFDMEVVIYDDKVFMASYRESGHLAILVKDAEIAKMMKELFRYVDSTLKQ